MQMLFTRWLFVHKMLLLSKQARSIFPKILKPPHILQCVLSISSPFWLSRTRSALHLSLRYITCEFPSTYYLLLTDVDCANQINTHTHTLARDAWPNNMLSNSNQQSVSWGHRLWLNSLPNALSLSLFLLQHLFSIQLPFHNTTHRWRNVGKSHLLSISPQSHANKWYFHDYRIRMDLYAFLSTVKEKTFFTFSQFIRNNTFGG